MRNLKRAFSLVLALVMVLSVMTIAPVAAADETTTTVTSNFADAAEINPDYMQAVAITGGIGLFAGADGKFMPKGTVTRAQMATIIVKMLYGGDVNADSFKGSGKFIDTAYFEGGWAEGYINWCATLGIVAGYGDGTFKPGNQVTTAEAATMILNALKIDAGEGTWPNTVMAKAEEEDFFEDLKPMPGTNVALSREELAVIALNGLNWSDSNEGGWYTDTNADMTFDNYKDALAYAGGDPAKVHALKGRDTLANKVYDLKSTTGWIVENQATGEKFTAVSVDGASAPVKFNVTTDANMIGHKVEVWYKETWTSEKKVGVTYAVSEVAEYITLNEKAENAKEYKAAFGDKYDLASNVVLTSSTGYVTKDTTIAGYVAGSAAPVGTYVIDNETGKLCGYIAPATYTVTKVSFVDTTADSEQIILNNGVSLKNTAEEDEVVEYDGIAKDDYVAYYQVQDVYVLSKLEPVVGNVTKIGENKESKKVITVGGNEYIQSAAAGTIPNTLTVAALDNPSFDYDQTYTFYLDPAGKFVCFEAVEGGSFDMANTFYVLGIISRTEADSYGQESTTYFARGVDMTGNEAMVPVGMQKDGGSLVGADEMSDFSDAEKGLTAAAYSFFSVEDNLDNQDTKKLGLKKLVCFPTAYNAKEPNATYSFEITSYGVAGADWQEGGKFEYGMASQFSNNGTLEAGVYCYNHKATKFIIVEGEVDQDYPLETNVQTGSATIKFAKNVPFKALFTRQANGTNNIEAMVFPMDVDHGLNATMVYVDKYHTTPAGNTSAGNIYEVHDALTGEAMEITLSSAITSIPVGFYSVGYDADEEIYKLAVDGEGTPIKAGAATTETKFEQRDYTEDGRYHESVVYDTAPTAFNGSTMWYRGTDGGVWSSTCSGTKVVDARTDEQITEDGVARITTMDQVWALKDSMPWVAVELDMCHTYSPSKVATIFVEVYNNKAYGLDNLVYSFGYGASEVTVVNGKINAMGDVIELPTGVTAGQPGFYNLITGDNGSVALVPAALDATAGAAFGTTDGVPTHDAIFNTTGVSALDSLNGFRRYDVVQYQTLELEDKTLLLVMGAGTEDEADLLSIEDAVVAAEYDSVVDMADKGITLSNIEDKQAAMCLIYSTYDMISGDKLLVVTAVDEGEAIDNDNASELDAITSAEVIDNTGNRITSVAGLKDKIDDGYVFSAKKYVVSGVTKLVITQCMLGETVSGTLTAADFANGFVKLNGDTTVGAGLSVAGDWTIDLNGYTLTGTAAPYFTVNTDTTLTIQDSGNGGKIQGLASATDAMIRVLASGTVNLEGGTLTGHNNSGSTGGAIGVKDGVAKALVNISGGAITNNVAKRGGGISVGDGGDSDLIVTGGTISGNSSTDSVSYGGIYSHTGGFAISGGTITDTICWRYGGTEVSTVTGNPVLSNLAPDANTTVTIGSLSAGANVTTATKDALTVIDDTVDHTEGTAAYAVASDVLTIKVVPADNGTVTVSTGAAVAGTEITVTATPDTGYELVEILVDGEAITGNTFEVEANHKVTATFVAIDYTVTKGAEDNGTFDVSATTANYGDTITVTTSPATGYEVLSVMVNGSEAGVTDNSDGTYTFVMPDTDVTVAVVFDLPSYTITKAAATNGTVTVSNKATAGTEVTITATPADGYEVDTITVTGASGNVAVTDNKFQMPAEAVTVTVTFKVEVPNVITAADFAAGGTVKLTKNSKLDASIQIKNVVTLDLNGYKLTGDAYPYLNIASNSATLTIMDSRGGGSIVGGVNASNDNYGMIFVGNGNLVLDSGKITGYKHTGTGNRGGAIALLNASTFTMNGGEISGNNGYNGGGLYLANTATATMTDGAIINNTATNHGGGVALDNTSTFTMEGGVISGNTALRGGGIVCIETRKVTLNIAGGTIENNIASQRGANIYGYDATYNISNGTIGAASRDGSDVATDLYNTELRGGTLNITGGNIAHIATNAGTGHTTVTISGNPVIGNINVNAGATTRTIGSLTAGALVNTATDNQLNIVDGDTTVDHPSARLYQFKAN